MVGLCYLTTDVSEPVSPNLVKAFDEFGESLKYLPSPRKWAVLTSGLVWNVSKRVQSLTLHAWKLH